MINLTITFEKVRKTNYPTSRYRYLYRFTDNNNRKIIETAEKIEIPVKPNDLFHQVSAGEEDALDSIAYKYYRHEGLWWVIATANNLLDPFKIEAGTVLRIPDYPSLKGYKGFLA